MMRKHRKTEDVKKDETLQSRTVSKALEKSEQLGQNAADTNSLPQAADEVEEKLPLMKKGAVKKVWDKVIFLWEKAKSPEIPARLKITIIGALLYLILPIDVVPDAIPGLGLIDDVSVILIVFREVSKFLLPKLEQKIEEKAYDAIYKKIDAKLSVILKVMIVNVTWTFLANMTGCAILVAKPFGNPASRYAALTVFALVFSWTVFRFVGYLIQYGKTTRKIVIAVIKERSISHGIASFVQNEYSYINRIYAGIEIAQNFIPEINKIPDLHEIAKVFETHYKKRIFLTAAIFLLYTALIWVTKFLLLHFSGN